MSPTLFAKNLIRLFKFDLKSFHKTIRRYADLDLMMDNLKYEIADEIRDMKLPKVLSQMETGGRETGLAISKEIVTALREIHAAGAHLMPVNDIDAIPYIVGD